MYVDKRAITARTAQQFNGASIKVDIGFIKPAIKYGSKGTVHFDAKRGKGCVATITIRTLEEITKFPGIPHVTERLTTHRISLRSFKYHCRVVAVGGASF